MSLFSTPMSRHMLLSSQLFSDPKMAKKMAKQQAKAAKNGQATMTNGAQPGATGSTASLPASPAALLSSIVGTPNAPQFDQKSTKDPLALYMTALNQANTQNDLRYRQSLGMLQGQGEFSKGEARRNRNEGFAEDTQSAISRGLGHTTVLDSARRRRDEELNRANQSIDESVAGRATDIISSRYDNAPDLGSVASLLQQQSAAEAQNKAQSKKTKSLIIGPKGEGGSAAGGSGGGGSNSYGGGGGSKAQGVQTYTNPSASQSFWGTAGATSGNATVGMPTPYGVNIFGYADPNRASAMKSKKPKKKGLA